MEVTGCYPLVLRCRIAQRPRRPFHSVSPLCHVHVHSVSMSLFVPRGSFASAYVNEMLAIGRNEPAWTSVPAANSVRTISTCEFAADQLRAPALSFQRFPVDQRFPSSC